MARIIYQQPHDFRNGVAVYDVCYEERNFELTYDPLSHQWSGKEFVFDDFEDDEFEMPLMPDEARVIAKLAKVAIPQERLQNLALAGY